MGGMKPRWGAAFVVLFIVALWGCGPVALRRYLERMTGFEGFIFVSVADGSDGNRGVLGEPLATIQAGIDTAYTYIEEGLADAVEVHVAAGTYEVRDEEGDFIDMKEGVSLYGGYSLDFKTRNPTVYVTTIEDTSTGGTEIAAVRACDGITEATVLDGFTILGGGGTTMDGWSTALDIERASPTVTNNTIIGGSASPTGYTIALDIYDDSSPLIDHNAIVGGNAQGHNYGITVSLDSFPTIRSNTINGGSSGISQGIFIFDAGAMIQNNSIEGGQGTTTRGIFINVSSWVSIKGNTVSGGSATGESSGILVMSENVTVEANTIYAGYSASWGTYGVHCVNVTLFTVRNNTILGGETGGTGGANGVLCNASSGLIFDNTIAGGIGEWGPGITLISSSAPLVENNIIFSSSTSGGYCIHEGDDNGGYAASIRNNTLWDVTGTTVLYCTYDGQTLDTAAAVNALDHADGNWDQNPDLADLDGADDDLATVEDNDWHLTAVSPVEARQGGRDGAALSWGFITDKDGATRTNLTQGPNDGPSNDGAAGWSMGACEQD